MMLAPASIPMRIGFRSRPVAGRPCPRRNRRPPSPLELHPGSRTEESLLSSGEFSGAIHFFGHLKDELSCSSAIDAVDHLAVALTDCINRFKHYRAHDDNKGLPPVRYWE